MSIICATQKYHLNFFFSSFIGISNRIHSWVPLLLLFIIINIDHVVDPILSSIFYIVNTCALRTPLTHHVLSILINSIVLQCVLIAAVHCKLTKLMSNDLSPSFLINRSLSIHLLSSVNIWLRYLPLLDTYPTMMIRHMWTVSWFCFAPLNQL